MTPLLNTHDTLIEGSFFIGRDCCDLLPFSLPPNSSRQLTFSMRPSATTLYCKAIRGDNGL